MAADDFDVRLEGDRWVCDKDPDSEMWYFGDVAKDLADGQTTAASVLAIVEGVTILVPAAVQGTVMSVKLGGLDVAEGAENCVTWRVTCANGEKFDRTLYFVRKDG